MESNSLSPYNLTFTDFHYHFTTDTGGRYSIAVYDQSSKMEEYCKAQVPFYEIALFEYTKKGKGLENRIGLTVSHFIIKTLEKDPNTVIVFSTDDGDGRARSRARLFNIWINKYCPDYLNFEALELKIGENYLTGYFLYFNEHPHRLVISAAINQMYTEKYS